MGQSMSFKLTCVFIVLVGFLQVVMTAPMAINKRGMGAVGGIAGLVQDTSAAAAGFNEGLTSSPEQGKGSGGGQGADQDGQGDDKDKSKKSEEDPEEEDPSDDQGEEKENGKKKNKQSEREMQAIATGENAKKSGSNLRSGIMGIFS